MLALLSIHPSRNRNLRTGADRRTPDIPIYVYVDSFGNIASRLTLPVGGARLSTELLIEDSGLPDLRAPDLPVMPVEDPPEDALPSLLVSPTARPRS
jgi:hypothetical protein